MRYFAVLFLLLFSVSISAQEKNIQGTVLSQRGYQPTIHANVVNLNSLKVTKTNANGVFTILAKVNDTLHISLEGYKSLKIKVTNEWFLSGTNKVYVQDLSNELDEVVINTLKLTGILSVDSKLIALADYPYDKDLDETGYIANYNRGFNPLNGIYNAIKRNSEESKKINQIRKEVELIEMMKKKFDREMAATLLNISKEDIVKILQRCDYSERFIYTANDFQIFNAVNECYENYLLGTKK